MSVFCRIDHAATSSTQHMQNGKNMFTPCSISLAVKFLSSHFVLVSNTNFFLKFKPAFHPLWHIYFILLYFAG